MSEPTDGGQPPNITRAVARNRAERRKLERAGEIGPKPKPWTREQTETFLAEKFTAEIAWTAARVLLDRVTGDVAWSQLQPELRESIVIFLERHPAK